MRTSNKYYKSEKEFAIASQGRIYFDEVIKAIRDMMSKGKNKIFAAGREPPKGYWDPIATRMREDPAFTKKIVVKAEKFPLPMYEEQRTDIRKLIEEKSTLKVGELALKPHEGLDGYVGVFYHKLTPYMFSYTSSKGFYFKESKDSDHALGVFNTFMDAENQLSVQRRRSESLEALDKWSDGVRKALGFTKDEGVFRLEGMLKALPKKSKPDDVKQAPKMIGANGKKAGSGGQVRYGYGAQGKEQEGGAMAPPPEQTPKQKEAQTDVSPADPEPSKFVDPNKFASLLQTTGEVLKRVAAKFSASAKLGGKKGFIKFFLTKFKDLIEKHAIRSHYLGLLYDSLTQPETT